MQLKGSRQDQLRQSHAVWDQWSQQEPLLSALAKRLAEDIERKMRLFGWHVDKAAESAFRSLGLDILDKEEQTLIFQMLIESWLHGTSLRHWAVGEGYLDAD